MSNKTKFIVNTSVEYFAASSNMSMLERDEQLATVLEFLENDEHTVISAVHNKSDGKIKFQHRIPNEEVCLLFYKIPQFGGNSISGGGVGGPRGAATTTSANTGAADSQPLGILTLEGGLVKSIYNSVSRVFSPQAEARKTEYTSEISGLLENLHVSLGSTLGLPQSGITSIKDEMKYWKLKFSHKSSTRIDREMSQEFIALLDNIDKHLCSINNGSGANGSVNAGSNIEEFLDSAHNTLDEIWRLPYQYPQARMGDILDIIGNRLFEICIEQLLAEDIWNLHSYHVNSLTSQCIDTIDSWLQLCDGLTRLFWPNYVEHPWLGDPHIPKRGQHLKERLADIRNIKNLFKQIATLLDDDEVRSIPFRDINLFDTSVLGQSRWNKALQQFEQLLQPIDERIASALKLQLHPHLSNPRQIIFIFSKYETLIQRPTVLELLTIEREQFLQSLQILLHDLRKAMTDTNMEPDTGHLSVICNECRWLKIVQHQIQEIEKVSHLITGREGYEKINKAVQEIKEETESLLRTNFEIWCGQCSTAVKSGDLKLRDDLPVVKFEKVGRQLMRVTFNPKLITFCQDVREFQNLGYNVPGELRVAATHASKFIAYARRLQQISTFHNTIGDRMIPCQRPIMLKNAMELSKLVQSETVAWNDEDAVERYVSMLQEAVSKLSADNTLLVGYHEQAKRTVLKLMTTDLLNQGQAWKDEMRHLRELVATLERQGYNNLDAFKLHWDYQLYKVLEYQYILGLVDMNNKLPDITIDLHFRQRQLCYRPPEEEIRDKYYTQLRRFIERPCGFRGLSEKSSDLFKIMIDNNRHYFGPLFERAEELFKKLEDFKQLWLPWVALGYVDVEELCGVHLNVADDWDRNFRACKNFSQQVAKLHSTEESIDCFVINILPLRSDIELISRHYWETLANSLRSSILNDVNVIQEFLQSSLQFLQNVPMDESSITESGMKYERMMSDLPKASETLALVKEKDICLAGWCKERVSALAGLLIQWEKLQPLIENHSVILQRQVELMKGQAQTQIQNLHNEAEKFQLRWESTIAELEGNEDATLELFKERQEYWKRIQARKESLLAECTMFNMDFPADVLQPFKEIEQKMEAQAKQWEIYDNFLTEFDVILKEDWTIYRRRPYLLNEFLAKWEGSMHASIDLPSQRIRQHVERLQGVMPVLQQLQSDALNERHWARVFVLLKKTEAKPVHNIIVRDILGSCEALQRAGPEIGNLVKQAASEQIVRQALTELDQWSVTANLKLINHTDTAGNAMVLIKDYQDVLNKIGDHQSLLQSAKNSSAFEAFSDQADLWENRLNTLDTLLSSLSQSQRRWVYLEPVFGAGTLRSEEALFRRIDKDFRYVMREIQADPRVISLVKINNIASIVNSLEAQLTRCQNNLLSYITEKRNSFPRFYFLGDDDLLELMGQASKDVAVIQKHIRKLFPGCHSLGIVQGSSAEGSVTHYTIQSVHSAEGDSLTLKQPVQMQGAIELWLNNLVQSIKQTLKEQILECSANAGDCFSENALRQYPIQVLSVTRAVNFTKQAEKAILSMSLKKQLESLNGEIAQYAALQQQTKNTLLQLKVRALLFDLVHYVSVLEDLVRHNVMHVSDWLWLSQMKFYLRNSGVGSDGVVALRMVYAEFEYSYEFLGNPNKLVSTSLTHKCYLILTQAMHMGLGGNPFGPAGTGKTECVKALGAMLGRLVLVFNCDENVDTESMGLILTGLARCGAWGCFDEFNRLQEATLSAISMLIQPIQTALKDRAEVVQIADKPIKLNHHCGIFVTLNPANAEYGGRQKLPGNCQALFRPIVMQQPEPREISRVMLFVEGFQQADEIAERIVELFELCARMLSRQRHYDWGLRELKTILLACGEGLREHKSGAINDINSSGGSGNTELTVVVRCVRTSTMSKLAQQDVARFDMLLRNVFPEIEIASATSALQQALSQAFVTLGLCANDRQLEKALQLHEQLAKRMGVVVVGPPGCGKSTVIALLRQALTTSLTSPSSTLSSSSAAAATNGGQQQIRLHTINPKSMSRVQLLGRLDPETRQWMDGVLTNTAVVVNGEPAQVHSWIVCDGSVDPEWIEALNSVLDDNKLLTLPSGWRIQFGSNVNFIFETDDLQHASPATISRMGIVNMNDHDYPQKKILDFLLSKEEFGDLLQAYMEDNFKPAADWVQREYLHTLPALSSGRSLVRSMLLQLRGIQTRDEFCAAVCRTLFGYLPSERHNELANKVYEKANIYIANPNHAELAYYDTTRGSFDYYASDADSMHTSSGQMDKGVQLIETAAVKSYLAVLQRFLTAAPNMPFMIVGPTAAAKTLLLQAAVQEHSGYDLVTINCSTQLTPVYVVHCLRQNCVTVSGLRGREYRPRQQRIVLFLKNLDLCYVDAWGASEIVELLLQLVQCGGFYADNLEWINVSGLQICSSVSQTPTASLLKLAPRYLAINQFLRVSYPTAADMLTVVQSRLEPLLLASRFTGTAPHVQYVIEGLMDFFNQLQVTFTPVTPGCAHYQFSPKFVMKVLDGLRHYPENSFNEALQCELLSVFKDRLISEEHAEEFDKMLKHSMRKLSSKDKQFFVPKTTKHNADVHALQHDEWLEETQKQAAICNAESFTMDEPITKELLEQTAKLARMLARSDTHIMLLGRPGGRQLHALHVAATRQQAKLLVLHGGSDFGLIDFYNELKLAMQTAAVEDQCTCLLIDHCWITCVPDIMKPVEAILEGSEILDLFGDDLESIASTLKHSAQLAGYQESLGSYFMQRVRRNLHLIVSLDPMNPNVDEYFSKYPALHRNMEFLCVRPASSETLVMLPKKFIEVLNESPISSKARVPVSSHFTDVLENLIPQQAPERYYQLIRCYYHIYGQLTQDINKRLEKLQHGVDKLASAHSVVDTLKSNAGKQEEALAEKRKLANDALEMISATMRNANDQKANMLELKKQAQVSSEQLKERQKEIQQELSEVEPILAEASAAVGQIKSEALSEIRSLRAPPEAIRDILEGVLRLMGIRDTSWNSMKTFLAKRGVKEDIRSLDPARINPENCEAVEKLLLAKADSFEMRNAKRASVAAAPLAAWVKASVRYSKVIQGIKPLEREQKELQRNLDVADGEVQTLMTGLDDVDNRVKQLSVKLNEYTQEAAVLELKLEEARGTLKAAEVLVEKLSSEFRTWSQQLNEYRLAHKTLDTKSLLIALAVCYFGHMCLEPRIAAMNNLTTNLQLKQPFDIRKNLVTEQEQIIWEGMGLASDAQIIENAALLRQMLHLPFGCCPIPLVLDPTQTAVNWLAEYLPSSSVAFEVTTQNSERLAYSLELAVRFGKTLVIQDCQNLRPPLLQLVTGRIYVRFNKRQVEVGSKLVDLHDAFRLVLSTKSSKLSIAAESRAHLTCIPFTVTAVGLTDQLLSKAIVLRSPDLERKRVDLLKNEGVLLKQRIELEDKLLGELSEAQGDILKNEKLLLTLNEVKESSSFIDQSLKESALVKKTLLIEYTQLKELCSKAAHFYICLTGSYELVALIYIKLFLRALATLENPTAENEAKIYEQLVRLSFQYLARSTARNSHLTLALSVCQSAYPELIKTAEWELFITNFMSSADASKISMSNLALPDYVPKEAAIKLQLLMSHVPELEEQLQLQRSDAWRDYVQQRQHEQPGTLQSAFHRVLVAQILRPDLMTAQMRQTAAKILGIAIDSVLQPSVEQLAEESSADRPILVITQSENDPATEIKGVAARKIGKEHYSELAIGKGMERRALEAIRQAAEAGKWVCLKNVHLVAPWLSELERELGSMKKANNFRLWLICESTHGFSEAVMYKFVKVLYEFPLGIKQKVRRMVQNYVAAGQRAPLKEAKLVKMRVAMFIVMAVLQERRQFIPQGWSKYYEFGEADLRAALDILVLLDASLASGRADWYVMQRLCENVAFGGRINNARDLQVLQRYLEEFCNAEVLSNRWSPLNLKITVPTTTHMEEYLAAIAKFPDVDEPETFKLSKYSNASREIEHAKVIVTELRMVYYKRDARAELSNNNESADSSPSGKWEKQVKPILTMWRKLAGKCSIIQTTKEIEEFRPEITPWSVFITSELQAGAKCFQEVHSTLSQVHAWLKESQSHSKSSVDESLWQTLAENQVPIRWRKVWSGPQIAVDYLKGLVVRVLAAEARYRTEMHLEFCHQIDFVGVFNVETFLSCLKLFNACKLGLSCKELQLKCSLQPGNENSSLAVVKVAPLKVDGLDTKLTPEIHLTYKPEDDKNDNISAKPLKSSRYLPLYSNASRELLICQLESPIAEIADNVLCGAALIVPDF